MWRWRRPPPLTISGGRADIWNTSTGAITLGAGPAGRRRSADRWWLWMSVAALLALATVVGANYGLVRLGQRLVRAEIHDVVRPECLKGAPQPQ